jgi:hypothetical protein
MSTKEESSTKHERVRQWANLELAKSGIVSVDLIKMS